MKQFLKYLFNFRKKNNESLEIRNENFRIEVYDLFNRSYKDGLFICPDCALNNEKKYSYDAFFTENRMMLVCSHCKKFEVKIENLELKESIETLKNLFNEKMEKKNE